MPYFIFILKYLILFLIKNINKKIKNSLKIIYFILFFLNISDKKQKMEIKVGERYKVSHIIGQG